MDEIDKLTDEQLIELIEKRKEQSRRERWEKNTDPATLTDDERRVLKYKFENQVLAEMDDETLDQVLFRFSNEREKRGREFQMEMRKREAEIAAPVEQLMPDRIGSTKVDHTIGNTWWIAEPCKDVTVELSFEPDSETRSLKWELAMTVYDSVDWEHPTAAKRWTILGESAHQEFIDLVTALGKVAR